MPRVTLDLYNCCKCGGTQSIPQSGYAVLTNDPDTGHPMTSAGQKLTRAQERAILTQPGGEWHNGSFVAKKPKRGLFG